VYDRPHLEDLGDVEEMGREWVPASEEESIRMFMETVEYALKWQATGSVFERVENTLKHRSKWWQDPRITRMTRGEFQSRFC